MKEYTKGVVEEYLAYQQRERYNNMTLTELYASQGTTLVDKFGK